MNIIEIIIGVLSFVLLVGVILLSAFGKEVTVLVPILTALVAWLLGKKQTAVLGFFKKKE